MALLLNKKFLLLFVGILCSLLTFSQEVDPYIERPTEKDYKDPEQFERYNRRRKLISAWQIKNLKTGALVVKLKTNKYLIEALQKEGRDELAQQKKMEMLGINKNVSKAFRNEYKFSKIYFIYSYNSDTLLKGARTSIFLDSNLVVDPTITMTESYYLICEPDYIYNSSIGFVPEDSARFQTERGTPTLESPIVIKNKYGHQLKKPFPFNSYYIGFSLATAKVEALEYVNVSGESVPFYINGSKSDKNSIDYKYKGKYLHLSLPKTYSYTIMSNLVYELNANLDRFFEESRMPNIEKFPEIKPFLY